MTNRKLSIKTPLHDGGFKGTTHVVRYSRSIDDKLITIKPTISKLFFYYSMIFVGLVILIYGQLHWILKIGNESVLLTIFSMLIISTGVFFLLQYERFIFSMKDLYLYRYKYRIFFYKWIRRYPYSEIHSIQVINKIISRSNGVTPFRSYELNIVLKSQDRINLLHDGNEEKIYHVARRLSKALNTPFFPVEYESRI